MGVSGVLAERTVVITGGGTGLGAAMVRRFTEEGARGVVLDLPQEVSLPPAWSLIPIDVRDEESVEKAMAEAAARLGTMDVVVANAGVVPGWSRLAEIHAASWDAVFDVNVRGVMLTIQKALAYMSRPGSIVVTGSLNSWRGDPNIAAYAASKHAVLGLVRSAALDLGPEGIRVNAVAPGPVATRALMDRLRTRRPDGDADDGLRALADRTALRRIATEDDIANCALFLASSMSDAITGQIIHVDGGIL